MILFFGYELSPPGKGWVRSFFGHAVDVGVFIFVPGFGFLGYAVEVGAFVSSGNSINSFLADKGWVILFFGSSITKDKSSKK